jgi:tetratricopeptide (TPR) repeat protein
MSRFSRLEFSETPQGRSDSRTTGGAKVRDEAYYLAEAQSCFEEGNYDQALISFSRVLEHDANNVEGWAGQVKILIELGEYREARLWVDKALEKFPQGPELLAAKAVALARLGELQTAMAFSDASFEEKGDSPYLWLARGDVLLAREEHSANYCFSRAKEHPAATWFVRHLVSRVLFHYRHFATSLKTVEEIIKQEGSRNVLWMQLGLCQYQLGMLDSAVASLDYALELNPRISSVRAAREYVSKRDGITKIRGTFRRLFSK